MVFRAEHYFYAAGEKLKEAHDAHHALQRYGMAMYWAGVATECMLRAHRMRIDRSFDSRHNIQDLILASRLIRHDEEYILSRSRSNGRHAGNSSQLKRHAAGVYVLWNNSVRYESDALTKARLRKVSELTGVSGDISKEASRRLLEHASHIIQRGTILWSN